MSKGKDSVDSRLGRIEGLLEQLLEQQEGKDERLRKVEIRQSYWAGASSFVGLLIGAALTYLVSAVRGHA